MDSQEAEEVCVHGVPGGHATFPHRHLAEVGAMPSARVQIKQCCLLCLRTP